MKKIIKYLTALLIIIFSFSFLSCKGIPYRLDRIEEKYSHGFKQTLESIEDEDYLKELLEDENEIEILYNSFLKLEDIEEKYSQSFRETLEKVSDSSYLDNILRDDEVIALLNELFVLKKEWLSPLLKVGYSNDDLKLISQTLNSFVGRIYYKEIYFSYITEKTNDISFISASEQSNLFIKFSDEEYPVGDIAPFINKLKQNEDYYDDPVGNYAEVLFQLKIYELGEKYSQEFADILETIEDKTYLDGIINNDEVLTSMNFFFETNQINKMLTLNPSFKSWNDLYGILTGRSDEVIRKYIDESIEYSGKISALVITCGFLSSTDYETAFFKYYFNNKNNIPTTIIQNKANDDLMESLASFYSKFQKYPLIKELIDEISVSSDFVMRDKSKKEILKEIASQISNPETKLDIIALSSEYNTTEKGIAVSSRYKTIYPKDISNIIVNNYIEGKKIIFINNFCYPVTFVEDMNLSKDVPITFINTTGKRVVSLADLPSSFFALADRGVTLEDLEKFGDDSTVNIEFDGNNEGKNYNRKMSIFNINDFELWIDNNDFMNFEPNIISTEEIPSDKPLIPYNIEKFQVDS